VSDGCTEVDLTGMLIPWFAGSARLIRMELSPHVYLPCFETERALGEVLDDVGITYDSIKRIDSHREFLLSVPAHVTVITNLRKSPQGTFRFTQIFRD
jgi:hypothetical protein